MITYGIVIAAIIVQILVSAGSLSSLMRRASGSALCLRDPGAFSEPYTGILETSSPRSRVVYVCRCFFQCVSFRKRWRELFPSAGLPLFLSIFWIGAVLAGISSAF